jgi:hypothetical protein
VQGLYSFVAALLLALPAATQADDVNKLVYDPTRVPVGRVFHYVKSNLDGTHPANVALYVAAQDRFETFTTIPGDSVAHHVVANIQWITCAVTRIESWRVPRKGAPTLERVIVDGSDDRSFYIETPNGSLPVERVDMVWRPWHLYSLDLTTLAITLPHLVNPKDSLTIALASASQPADSTIYSYAGKATLRYRHDEPRSGKACHTYDVDGPAMGHRGGTIWTRASDGMIQDVELGLPTSRDWTGFKLRLAREGGMTDSGWKRFMKSNRR